MTPADPLTLALAHVLAWARAHLASLARDVEAAQLHRSGRGGQHAGVPALGRAGPGVLAHVEREVRAGLGGSGGRGTLEELMGAGAA